MRRWAVNVLVAAIVYAGGYLAFRAGNQEVWSEDGKTYVIFPTGPLKALYYLWRPLTYLDGTLTGMAFHIGPHQ